MSVTRNIKRQRRSNNTHDVKIEKEVKLVLRKQILSRKPCKFFDTYATGSQTTTIGYSNLTPISLGTGLGQRVSNTIWVDHMECRLNIVAANADVYSNVRFFFFKFKQNTASVTPGSGSVIEDSGMWGVLSPLNFEGRAYYKLFWDQLVNLTGTATAPTTNSQHNYIRNINLGRSRIDYEVAATTGVGHLYIGSFSDSAIAPSPVLTFEIRVWYFDEE